MILVKVSVGPKVTEVALEDGATVGEAIKAAGERYDYGTAIRVTGVPVCPGTPLRNNDVVVLLR